MTESQEINLNNIARLTKTNDTGPPSTIVELYERYCHETILRAASKETYDTAVRVFERDTGITDPRKVNHEAILLWRDNVIKRASLMTWNTYRRGMKTLFNFAVRNKWLEENLFLSVKPATLIKRKKTLSKKAMKEVIMLLKCDSCPILPGWFWLTVFKTLYYTGMRRRQLCALRWRDIDFDRKTILLSVEGSKTAREWEIPIPAQCEKELIDLKRESEARHVGLEKCQVFWVQLFETSYVGRELSPTQLTHAFGRLSDHLGIAVSPHKLRHTMATDLASGPNPDLKSLQYLLGHTNLATTLEYVNPEMSQLRVQLSKLSLDLDGLQDVN